MRFRAKNISWRYIYQDISVTVITVTTQKDWMMKSLENSGRKATHSSSESGARIRQESDGLKEISHS
jgi:hypothetical protein